MKNSKDLIGDFIAGAPSNWGEPAAAAAALAICDTLAVALASRSAAINAKASAAFGRRISGTAGSILWLSGDSADPETAAFLNAVAAHALDYDDVAPAWRGHPGAVILPALAALSAHPQAAGRSIVDAYSIGFEVGAALGRAVVKSHYPAGWHSTATIGVLAATAACCRLLGCSAKISGHAMGIAVAQAAGARSNFGTETKPLQAGFASAAAIRSTLLALAGIDSGAEVVDGQFGFLDLYSGGSQASTHQFDALQSRQPTLSLSHEIKIFPTCYATHRAIHAVLEILCDAELRPGSIGSIDVESSPGSHDALRSGAPLSADEAKFHMPTVLAMALLDGQVGLKSFAAGRHADSDIKQLAAKIHVSEVSQAERTPRWTKVRIETGGQTLERRIDELPPVSLILPSFLAKVSDCLGAAGPGSDRQYDALVGQYLGAEFLSNFRSLTNEHFQAGIG